MPEGLRWLVARQHERCHSTWRRFRSREIRFSCAAEPTPSAPACGRSMPFRERRARGCDLRLLPGSVQFGHGGFPVSDGHHLPLPAGSFISSAVVSLLGVMGLAYFFAPPIFSLHVDDPFNMVAIIIAFLIVSAVITRLVSKLRSARRSWRPKSSSGSEPRKRCSVPEQSCSASPA